MDRLLSRGGLEIENSLLLLAFIVEKLNSKKILD